MIESIISIFKKDRRKLFDLFHDRIYLSITKNDRFDRKSDDWIPNPAILRVAAAHPTVSQVQLVPQVRQVMSTGLKLKEMFSLPPKLVRSMHCPCHPPMGEEVVNVVHGSRINTLHRSRPEGRSTEWFELLRPLSLYSVCLEMLINHYYCFMQWYFRYSCSML